MRITITLTNELPPTSPTCLQFYNIIFRRCMPWQGACTVVCVCVGRGAVSSTALCGHLKMWFLTGKLICLPPGFYPFPSGADNMPLKYCLSCTPAAPSPGWVGGCWGKWQPHEEQLARTCSRHWGDGCAGMIFNCVQMSSTHKKPAVGICM